MNSTVIAALLQRMGGPTLTNYVVPGLESTVLEKGKVRFFRNTRHQLQTLVPHSHRYHFACCVIEGSVENTVWSPSDRGDSFSVSRLDYRGAPGAYGKAFVTVDRFVRFSRTYTQGEWYTMKRHDYHSIVFSHDAVVLFLEGPSHDESYVLEPVVDGKLVPTLKTEPWMFMKKEAK